MISKQIVLLSLFATSHLITSSEASSTNSSDDDLLLSTCEYDTQYLFNNKEVQTKFDEMLLTKEMIPYCMVHHERNKMFCHLDYVTKDEFKDICVKNGGVTYSADIFADCYYVVDGERSTNTDEHNDYDLFEFPICIGKTCTTEQVVTDDNGANTTTAKLVIEKELEEHLVDHSQSSIVGNWISKLEDHLLDTEDHECTLKIEIKSSSISIRSLLFFKTVITTIVIIVATTYY